MDDTETNTESCPTKLRCRSTRLNETKLLGAPAVGSATGSPGSRPSQDVLSKPFCEAPFGTAPKPVLERALNG